MIGEILLGPNACAGGAPNHSPTPCDVTERDAGFPSSKGGKPGSLPQGTRMRTDRPSTKVNPVLHGPGFINDGRSSGANLSSNVVPQHDVRTDAKNSQAISPHSWDLAI